MTKPYDSAVNGGKTQVKVGEVLQRASRWIDDKRQLAEYLDIMVDVNDAIPLAQAMEDVVLAATNLMNTLNLPLTDVATKELSKALRHYESLTPKRTP